MEKYSNAVRLADVAAPETGAVRRRGGRRGLEMAEDIFGGRECVYAQA